MVDYYGRHTEKVKTFAAHIPKKSFESEGALDIQLLSCTDGQALKEVFDVKGGSFSFGMGMNGTEGVWAALSLTASSRN